MNEEQKETEKEIEIVKEDSSTSDHEETPKKRWYVVQVISSQEKKISKAIWEGVAAAQMEDLIEEVFVPIERLYEVKQGERRIIEKKLWPGYILVKMFINDDSWTYIKYTRGVLNFKSDQIPMDDEEVKKLQNAQNQDDEVVQKYVLNVGDRIKITEGVFLNFEGEIINIFQEKGVVSVMVEIFGRQTRVDDLEFRQVEVLE